MRFPAANRDAGEGAGLPRAILLLLPAWWTVSLSSGFSSWCFLDGVNLAFHEAGHLLLSFAGSTLHYLGGTLGQLAVPGLLVAHFLLRQRQPFGAALCLWWLGENLVNVAHYMADARTLSLPLVGGGDHDWNELFFRFGLLGEPSVRRVATTTHLAGMVVMAFGLLWAIYFVLPRAARERVRDGLRSHAPWIDPLLEA